MTLMRKLRDELIQLFEVAPVCLYKSYTKTQIFLSAFIGEAGPLFIALDEIGAAFTVQGKNDIDRRELFLRFCAKVLGSWLLVPGLFFLVLGRGSFLSYVGNHPDDVNITSGSPFSFQRLSLQLLRTEAIVEILKKTYVGETTLYNYYKLSPETATKVAVLLFQQTTGNPRHLVDAFERCETYEELMKYDESFVIKDYERFCVYVSKYQRIVQSLLSAAESKSMVDLTEEITSKGRSITLEIIANNVLIAWEGRLEAAQLVASPTIIDFMATIYYPFKQYLELITKFIDGPLNFPEAFEIMLMKRFQEMFASPSCPKDILPSFFDSPKFGQIPDLVCCSLVRRMGKVISSGSGMKLEGLTINMGFWPVLIEQMDSFESLCLKPLPLSASSDIIFVGDIFCGSVSRRCTVGVAAKTRNYQARKAKAGQSLIDEECFRFNAMFEGMDLNCRQRLNILIICSTNYDDSTMTQFGDKKFFVPETEQYPLIDEVIVLDLSSTENRAAFFGLSAADALNNSIDRVIAKDTVYTTQWGGDDC